MSLTVSPPNDTPSFYNAEKNSSREGATLSEQDYMYVSFPPLYHESVDSQEESTENKYYLNSQNFYGENPDDGYSLSPEMEESPTKGSLSISFSKGSLIAANAVTSLNQILATTVAGVATGFVSLGALMVFKGKVENQKFKDVVAATFETSMHASLASISLLTSLFGLTQIGLAFGIASTASRKFDKSLKNTSLEAGIENIKNTWKNTNFISHHLIDKVHKWAYSPPIPDTDL